MTSADAADDGDVFIAATARLLYDGPALILNADHELVEVDPVEAMRWMANPANRRVAHTVISDAAAEASEVSTVFLGSLFGRPPRSNLPSVRPDLFETMVLSGPCKGAQLHCATWAEAEKIHRLVLERVKALVEGAAL